MNLIYNYRHHCLITSYLARGFNFPIFLLCIFYGGLSNCSIVKSDIADNSSIKLTEISSYQSDTYSLQSLEFTKNNKQILLGYYPGAIVVDVATGKKSYDIAHGDISKRVVLSENNKYLLITTGAVAKVWDFNTRKKLKQWDISVDMLGAISPDEKWLLAGNNIVDVDSLETIAKLEVLTSLSKPAFSYDNRFLVVGSHLGTLLFDLKQQSIISEWRIGGWDTEGFFTPDSKYLLLLHGDKPGVLGHNAVRDTISVFYPRKQIPIFSIDAGADITAHIFDNNNQYLFVATEKGKITRWDLNSQKMLNKWNTGSRVRAMAADNKGNVWVSLENGNIMVYQMVSQQLKKVTTLPNDVTALDVSRNGELLSIILTEKAKSKAMIFKVNFTAPN